MSPRAVPLRLDPTACDACGRCAPLCRSRALKVGPGYILVDWNECDGCGACAEACERGAIVLKTGDGRAAREPAEKSSAPPPARDVGKAAPAKAAKLPKAAKPLDADAGPEWSLPEAALALLVAFTLYIASQSVPGAWARAPIASGAMLIVYNAALTGLLYFLARRRGLTLPRAFRLDLQPEWSSVGAAVALAAGCWLVSVLYRAAAPIAGFQPPSGDGADLTTLFGTGPLAPAATILVVAVLAPVIEEALLRGVVLGALRGRFGPWPAIVASAIAFSLLHASAWSFIPLTVLGVALGWLAVRSRSLWPAVGAHVLYNAVLVGAALYKALGA